jgi:3-oxoacyl-[acyl-carrier-protein] synthase II
MKRRVFIVGAGLVSSAGTSVEESRPAFLTGTCCLSPLTDPRAAKLRAKFAGIARGVSFNTPPVAPAELELQDRHAHLALRAAHEAMAEAKLRPADLGHRLGLIFSTCSGPMLRIEAHYRRILAGNPQLTADELFAKRYYSAAQVLAASLGIQGFNTTVVTACSASTAAIALAADLIRCGMLDAAVAGGADSLSISTLAGFDGLKATSESRCAPFSKPYGLNLGEGAGFLVLQAADRFQGSEQRWLGEILGSGTSNDAHHCSAPDPNGRGLSAAMARALRDAGLSTADIAYINAHGTGTEANDRAEIKAVRKVFGDTTARIPISSTKSMVGHCLGAAGAIEAIATLICAQAGVLPPTANFTEPRDGCAIDAVPDAGRPWIRPRLCLSNNSAFGGHNASVVLNFDAAVNGPSPTPHLPASTSHNASPRIVITATGVVTAAGLGSAALSAPLPEPAPQPPRHDLNQGLTAAAALIDESKVEAYDRRLDLRSMDRSSRWATVAARLAIREGRFPESSAALADLGLFLALSAGPSWAENEFLTSFLRNHDQVSQLGAFPYIVPSSVVGNVCRALRVTGHNLTLSAGPGAGLFSLIPALGALRAGHAHALLAGAVDELSDRIVEDTASARSQPGSDVPTFPPGEGAAFLLLETAEHAAARQVTPLAEILGATCRSDTGHSPDSVAPLRAVVHEALQQANLTAEAVTSITYQGPDDGLAMLPAPWTLRRRCAPRSIGCLEGTQPLVDLAAMLGAGPISQRLDVIVAIAWIPGRLAGCVILQT